MDAIVLRDKPTDDKCNNCSLTYIKDGVIVNGVIHELVDNSAGKFGCTGCSMRNQCFHPDTEMDVGICTCIFETDKCHFEIK